MLKPDLPLPLDFQLLADFCSRPGPDDRLRAEHMPALVAELESNIERIPW